MSWCFVAFALCALSACDKTSSSNGPNTSEHGADGGGGARSDVAANSGSPAVGDHAGQSSIAAEEAGKSSQAGAEANAGAGEPQGGDAADQGGSTSADAGANATSHAGDSAAGAGGEAGAGGMGSAGQGGSDGAAGSGGSGETVAVCEPPWQCVGPALSASACGLAPLAVDAPITSMTCPGMRTCTDAPAPHYRLLDFQRLSCGTNATYGLDAFLGRPTLVAIFGSWCPYCQGQTEKLDQLRLELQTASKDIYIVIVNQSGYETSQEELRSRSSVPMLQDTASVNAWGIHGVEKDDLLIYRSDGTLEAWLPPGNMSAPIDLTTDLGYAYVKMRLMNTL